MNVLLLGNGFDINCGLPTKYINFVEIVGYFHRHREKEYKTIGELFKAMIEEKSSTSISKLYDEKENKELFELYNNIEIKKMIYITHKRIVY